MARFWRPARYHYSHPQCQMQDRTDWGNALATGAQSARSCILGLPARNRTRGLSLPKRALYQHELQADVALRGSVLMWCCSEESRAARNQNPGNQGCWVFG